MSSTILTSRKTRWLKKFWNALPYICITAFMAFILFSVSECMKSMQIFYDSPYHNTRDIRELRTILQTLRNDLSQEFALETVDFDRVEKILNNYYPKQDIIVEKIIESLPEQAKGHVPELEKVINDLKIARIKTTEFVKSNPALSQYVSYYTSQIIPPLDRLNDILLQISNSSDVLAREIMYGFTVRHKAVELTTALLTIFLISFLLYHRQRDKAKNEAIAHREQLFNILGANIDDVFLIVNAERQIEFASSNSKRVIGIPASQILEDPAKVYDYLGPVAGEWLRQNIEDESGTEYIEKEADISGESKQLVVGIYPVSGKGRIRLKIVVISDQTEIVARERALKDALESSRRANAAKSAFLANMSHEIRTPLNVIIGLNTIAQTKLDDHERVKDCLEKIGYSSRHLLGLINDVLDMSKIEGGKLRLNLESFNLRHLIQELINIAQPQALEKKQSFDVFLDSAEYEFLIGDALRLRQILINLLNNAIKFTPANGSIILRVNQLPREKGRVLMRFAVTDTGKGMSQEFLERVYEPFEQANPGVAAKFGGSGLGLAITRNIVSLMDGSINVKSEEGKGTEFLVEVPLEIDEKEQAKEKGPLPELKVLVVNENEEVCEQASRILDKLGMRSDWTHNIQDAIRKLELAIANNDDFDVCFVDEKIHAQKEVDPIGQLKRTFGEKPLVILISAYDWRSLEKEALPEGVQVFVEKPFFASSVFDALRNISPQNEKSAETESQGGYDFNGKRVLLVEDNDFNREIATEFLEMANLCVEHAVNGREGLEKFAQSAQGYFDLVLMDIQMPVMNGYDAARALRKLPREDAKSVPVVAMTANAFDDDVASALAAGMNNHIPKPINVEQLYAILEKYLGG